MKPWILLYNLASLLALFHQALCDSGAPPDNLDMNNGEIMMSAQPDVLGMTSSTQRFGSEENVTVPSFEKRGGGYNDTHTTVSIPATVKGDTDVGVYAEVTSYNITVLRSSTTDQSAMDQATSQMVTDDNQYITFEVFPDVTTSSPEHSKTHTANAQTVFLPFTSLTSHHDTESIPTSAQSSLIVNALTSDTLREVLTTESEAATNPPVPKQQELFTCFSCAGEDCLHSNTTDVDTCVSTSGTCWVLYDSWLDTLSMGCSASTGDEELCSSSDPEDVFPSDAACEFCCRSPNCTDDRTLQRVIDKCKQLTSSSAFNRSWAMLGGLMFVFATSLGDL